MNILHVTLGNPKQHAGGLNRYCADLMEQQTSEGNSVSVLYAGVYLPGKKTRIRKISANEFAIDGALPVAITYGIDNPIRYMESVSSDVYRKWLLKEQPKIIHVHSFMGVHKEFFEVAKELKIPMVFTTHDYYPCCFRCNLVDKGSNVCMESFDVKRCQKCNVNAGLSQKTQILLQSEFYQRIKKWSIIKQLKRKRVVSQSKLKTSENDKEESNYAVEDFEKLHCYYSDIMQMMSVVHCNSQLTKQIYEKHYPTLNYQVIPITHSGITRKIHSRKDANILHISYFGGMNQYKGYYQLKDVLEKLIIEDEGWDISLYGGEYTDTFEDERVKVKGMFSREEETEVWENTDLLIVPSQWPETFGFVVLEAIAGGIPVICSDLVGAGYLIEDLLKECTYRYDNNDALYQCIIRFLDVKFYENFQGKVRKIATLLDMEMHGREIQKVYKCAEEL